jgi:hypothetical protein
MVGVTEPRNSDVMSIEVAVLTSFSVLRRRVTLVMLAI